jgi:hypothetical protein
MYLYNMCACKLHTEIILHNCTPLEYAVIDYIELLCTALYVSI